MTLVKGDNISFKNKLKELGINTIEYGGEINALEEELDQERKTAIAILKSLQKEEEGLDAKYEDNKDSNEYEQAKEKI